MHAVVQSIDRCLGWDYIVLGCRTIRWNCKASGLLPGAARLLILAAWLIIAAARLYSCRAVDWGLQGCMAAWLHGCKAARLHGCKAAWLSELVLLQLAALLVQLSCNS